MAPRRHAGPAAARLWSSCYNRILWQIRQNPKMKTLRPIFTLAVWALVATFGLPQSMRKRPRETMRWPACLLRAVDRNTPPQPLTPNPSPARGEGSVSLSPSPARGEGSPALSPSPSTGEGRGEGVESPARVPLTPNPSPARGEGSFSPSPAKGEGSGQAEALLDQVAASVDRFDSISARVRQQIDLFDNQILGTGLYFQQGHAQQRLTRMEVRSQSGERATTMLEVCDSRNLWTFHGTPGGSTVSRIDFERVEKAFADAAAARAAQLRDFQVRERLAQPGRNSARIEQIAPLPDRPAASGLPKLLDGLRDNFQFERTTPGRLGEMPVWIVEGVWKPARLIAAVPDQKANIEAGRPIELKKLPPQLPERVVIEVGQQDLFPYRIQYLRRAKSGSTANTESDSSWAEPMTAHEGYRALVILELFDVHVNVQIDPRQFTFQAPAGTQVSEATDGYLKSLNLLAPAK